MKASPAAAPAPCPFCGELQRHRVLCPEWPAWHATDRAKAQRVVDLLEERATGKVRLKSVPDAIGKWARRREAWASPKALPLDPDLDGTGRLNQGLDSPARRQHAAIVWAIKMAEDDDRERHPTRSAPLETWLALHFIGVGRNSSFTYAEIADRSPGAWAEAEVARRIKRALHIIRTRLREGRWLEEGSDVG